MALPIIDENQAIYYVRWNTENVAIGATPQAAREIIDLLTRQDRCENCGEPMPPGCGERFGTANLCSADCV